MFKRFAARVKLNSSATATKHRSWKYSKCPLAKILSVSWERFRERNTIFVLIQSNFDMYKYEILFDYVETNRSYILVHATFALVIVASNSQSLALKAMFSDRC